MASPDTNSRLVTRTREKCGSPRHQPSDLVGELNNVLLLISGFNDILLNHLDPEEPLRSNAEEIRRAADRAAQLIHQLSETLRHEAVRRDESRQPAQPVPPTRELVPAFSGVEGKTILVVEDDQNVRRLICEFLAESYKVLEAGDGLKALQFADRADFPIDLLLTDLDLPEMGGRELARRFAVRRPGVKVIFMSSFTGSAPGADSTLRENDLLLQKPFSLSALERTVAEMLGVSAANPG